MLCTVLKEMCCMDFMSAAQQDYINKLCCWKYKTQKTDRILSKTYMRTCDSKIFWCF